MLTYIFNTNDLNVYMKSHEWKRTALSDWQQEGCEAYKTVAEPLHKDHLYNDYILLAL